MNTIIALIIILLLLSLISEIAFFFFHVAILTVVFNHVHTQMTRKNISFGDLPMVLSN